MKKKAQRNFGDFEGIAEKQAGCKPICRNDSRYHWQKASGCQTNEPASNGWRSQGWICSMFLGIKKVPEREAIGHQKKQLQRTCSKTKSLTRECSERLGMQSRHPNKMNNKESGSKSPPTIPTHLQQFPGSTILHALQGVVSFISM